MDIIRTNSDYTESLIKLDLRKALDLNEDSNIGLQGSDLIRVYGMTEMVPSYYVSIRGHVLRPGNYVLREGMTLYDLILKQVVFWMRSLKKEHILNVQS